MVNSFQSKSKTGNSSLCVFFICCTVCTFGRGILLPYFWLKASLLHATSIELNFILGIIPVGTILLVPIIGSLSDYIGRKQMLFICLSSAFVGYLLASLASTLFILLLSQIFLVIGSSTSVCHTISCSSLIVS